MKLLSNRTRVLVTTNTDSLGLLLAAGYDAVHAEDGDRARDALQVEPFDAAIFDLRAPGRHAFDLCRQARANEGDAALLLVAAAGQEADGIAGLRLGADDFVTAPLNGTELLARLEAVLRRCRRGESRKAVYTLPGIQVNFRSAEVTCGGDSIRLSALELKLLRYLIEHRGEVLSRDELLNEVWGYDEMPATRTVDVRISSLRRKLESRSGGPVKIVTVHGLGYKFIA
jgi:two-component system alkaline phosphatase synthesis response regulator PhoP